MSILSEKNGGFIISELNIDDIIYRGEGNLSLVVSLKSLNKVIRIPKVKKDEVNIDLEAIKNRLSNEIRFSWDVMCKLFGPNIWINRYSLIRLSKKQMIEIKNKVEDSRPNYRKSKILPPLDYFGLIIDDYCSFQNVQLNLIRNHFPDFELNGPVYGIEIKPKQGFISQELYDLHVCKFRLKQEEKLSLSLIKKPSAYCPLDLFSGDEERMKFALNSLIKNPQNNFRLFINKEYIPLEGQMARRFDEIKNDNLDKNKLIDLLIFVLNYSFNDKNPEENHLNQNNPCRYHFNNHRLDSVKQLNPNSILKAILKVQKLDEIGSTKAAMLHDTLKSKYNSSYNEWINETRNSIELNLNETGSSKEELTEPESIKQQLTRFLYSLTAKDCSILITFQKFQNISQIDCNQNFGSRLGFYESKTDDSVYLFTLALIDLDRKQPEKIERTFEGDQKRINNFLSKNYLY